MVSLHLDRSLIPWNPTRALLLKRALNRSGLFKGQLWAEELHLDRSPVPPELLHKRALNRFVKGLFKEDNFGSRGPNPLCVFSPVTSQSRPSDQNVYVLGCHGFPKPGGKTRPSINTFELLADSRKERSNCAEQNPSGRPVSWNGAEHA